MKPSANLRLGFKSVLRYNFEIMIKDFIKSYLSKIKTYTIFVFVIFLISIFLGYALAHAYPEKTKEIVYENLKNLIEPAKNYSPFQMFGFIFFQNLTVALISIFLGIIFGFIPVLITIINGLSLGVVSSIFQEQFNLYFFMAGILPHGIIEIPAFIFSAASGLWLWRSIWQRLLYDKGNLKEEFFSIIVFFVLVIAPMLIVAAMIETFITPRILNLIIF